MKIPSQVKIGGLNYPVKMVKNEARDNCRFGSSCGYAKEIVIDDSVDEQQQETTLIHEVLEQIDGMYQLEIPHNKLCTLEAALYGFIKDNPEVFKEREEYVQNGSTESTKINIVQG